MLRRLRNNLGVNHAVTVHSSALSFRCSFVLIASYVIVNQVGEDSLVT